MKKKQKIKTIKTYQPTWPEARPGLLSVPRSPQFKHLFIVDPSLRGTKQSLCHCWCFSKASPTIFILYDWLVKTPTIGNLSFFLHTFSIAEKVCKKARPSKATHPLGLTHGPHDGQAKLATFQAFIYKLF
jgi:hypothetical protein